METVSLKKLTIRDVLAIPRGEDIKQVLIKHAKEESEIVAIAGDVTGYGIKNTQYGESFFFTGTFVAQNRLNGKIYKASKCYLTKDFSETLRAQFENRKNIDEYVSFQAVIKVVEDDRQGFAYVVEQPRTAQAITREAELLATFAQLPPPVKPKQIAKK